MVGEKAMGTPIEFIGYAADCRVEGRLELEDARLADLLNREQTITLRDVLVTSHHDGQCHQLDQLQVERDELEAVVASGPRGDPARRLATRPNGVEMRVGSYVAEGYMHAPPTANPVRNLQRRPPMVALTDAIIEYRFCDQPVAERFPTILVNRTYADSLRAAGGLGAA